MGKPVIHVSDTEAANNFSSLLKHVSAGGEVIIAHGARPIAVVRPAVPERRTLLECIALLSEESLATIDPDFAKDVAAAIDSHRESLNPPAWD